MGLPSGWSFQKLLGEDLVDEVLRVVGLHLELFEHDALLFLDVLVLKSGFRTRSERMSKTSGRCSSSTLALKLTISLAVKASRLPPMESTDRAMSSAERLVVPLNTMCSMKCEMPFSSGDSWREPVPIQMPTATERTCGMVSVIKRIPLASEVTATSRTVGVAGDIRD